MLPVAELLVAAAVAGPPAVQLMRSPPRFYRLPNGKFTIDMRNPAVQRWLADGGPRFPSRFEDVWYLNFPAILLEMPTGLLATAVRGDYRPAWTWPLGPDGYRALTLPTFALPFWFLAGRGIDALGKRGRTTAFEAFLMGFIGLAMLLSAAAFLFSGSDPSLHPAYEQWAQVPIAMWFAFGVICQIAWWRQRAERKAKNSMPVPI